MDQKLIDAVRSKYQFEMKESVYKISLELEKSSEESINKIDSLLNSFSKAKEKLSYFEAIIKNLKGEEE